MKSTLLTLVCILSTGIQDPHYPFRRDSYKHSTLSMEGRYKLGQLFQDMSPKGVDADHTIYHNLIIILQKYLNPKSFFISGSLIAGAFVTSNWGLSFAVPGMIIGGVGFLLFLFLVPDPANVGLSPATVVEPRNVDVDPEGDPLIDNRGMQ